MRVWRAGSSRCWIAAATDREHSEPTTRSLDDSPRSSKANQAMRPGRWWGGSRAAAMLTGALAVAAALGAAALVNGRHSRAEPPVVAVGDVRLAGPDSGGLGQ